MPNTFLDQRAQGLARNQQALLALLRLRQQADQFQQTQEFRQEDLDVERERNKLTQDQQRITNARLDKAENRLQTEQSLRVGKLLSSGEIVKREGGSIELPDGSTGEFASLEELGETKARAVLRQRVTTIRAMEKEHGFKVPEEAATQFAATGFMNLPQVHDTAREITRAVSEEADAKGLTGTKRAQFLAKTTAPLLKLIRPTSNKADKTPITVLVDAIQERARLELGIVRPEQLFGTFVSDPLNPRLESGQEKEFVDAAIAAVNADSSISQVDKDAIITRIRADLETARSKYLAGLSDLAATGKLRQ